ncbi:MAG: hypothetical protein N4A48_01840 [Tepidibacter sp.]|nr:hypothetical protein [Tepidibacter sp.]MCT4507497.1 hypothetical protein [Tepidibacter sp.]
MEREIIEKQKQQIQAENQKLMKYISAIREDKKKKTGFLSKLFRKGVE